MKPRPRPRALAAALMLSNQLAWLPAPLAADEGAPPAPAIAEALARGPEQAAALSPARRRELAGQVRRELALALPGDPRTEALHRLLSWLETGDGEPEAEKEPSVTGPEAENRTVQVLSDALKDPSGLRWPAVFDGSRGTAPEPDAVAVPAGPGKETALKTSGPSSRPNLTIDAPPMPAAAEKPAPPEEERGVFGTFFDQVYHPADGENTKWLYVPVKVVTYPIAKLMYDVPNLMTSTVVESVNRSTIHNAQGFFDGLFGFFKRVSNAGFDMGRGILNPTNGAFIDGVLGMGDAALSVVKTAAQAVKTGVSLVAYPIYRLAGGAPSERASLPGSGPRAAIVLIDSSLPGAAADIVDSFGDQIVRYHLAQSVDYYCAATLGNSAAGTVEDCLKKIPLRVKTVDIFALTHSGGTWRADKIAERLKGEGKTIGVVQSIGCYDAPSSQTTKENTVGQTGLSWAVHYYLSSMVEKRYRGIPMPRAAEEAYNESAVFPNLVNPISIGGRIVAGYEGSRPVPAKQ